MQQVQAGDFSLQIPIKSKDEIGVISQAFNEMCERLNSYISEVYAAEIQRKNAELNALQTQIDPHFLYNTLDSIRAKALAAQDEDCLLYTSDTVAVTPKGMSVASEPFTIGRIMNVVTELVKEDFEDKDAGQLDSNEWEVTVPEKAAVAEKDGNQYLSLKGNCLLYTSRCV